MAPTSSSTSAGPRHEGGRSAPDQGVHPLRGRTGHRPRDAHDRTVDPGRPARRVERTAAGGRLDDDRAPAERGDHAGCGPGSGSAWARNPAPAPRRWRHGRPGGRGAADAQPGRHGRHRTRARQRWDRRRPALRGARPGRSRTPRRRRPPSRPGRVRPRARPPGRCRRSWPTGSRRSRPGRRARAAGADRAPRGRAGRRPSPGAARRPSRSSSGVGHSGSPGTIHRMPSLPARSRSRSGSMLSSLAATSVSTPRGSRSASRAS